MFWLQPLRSLGRCMGMEQSRCSLCFFSSAHSSPNSWLYPEPKEGEGPGKRMGWALANFSPGLGGLRSPHTHALPCLLRVFFPWAGCVFPELAVSQPSLAHGSAVGYCCCRKRTDALRELKCNIKWLPMLCPAGLLQPFLQRTFAEYLLRWLCTGRCFSSPWAGQVW